MMEESDAAAVARKPGRAITMGFVSSKSVTDTIASDWLIA